MTFHLEAVCPDKSHSTNLEEKQKKKKKGA